ncbi:putative TAFII55 protein region [Helianthus annuus]|nr:putative TAFII55 protein region [Helianthus annuus]
MEEQFILRVPPSVAERIDRLLDENASDDKSLDLSFSDDGRNGTFVIRRRPFFPHPYWTFQGIVESYKTYDDSVLIKTADVGQIIMVRDEGDPAPDVVEYRHGLTPPMRDARRRRFRREPDLNPELVRRVEKDLLNIMNGGTAEIVDTEMGEQEEVGDGSARNARKKAAPAPPSKPSVSGAGTNAGEPERSDSDESDDSM